MRARLVTLNHQADRHRQALQRAFDERPDSLYGTSTDKAKLKAAEVESSYDHLLPASSHDWRLTEPVRATGEKETRAWTIRTGMTAPQAAGVIHSDFEKGFIRAETVAYDDFTDAGSTAKARDNGKLRLEGKEYVVKEGDIMNFRFNV